MQSLCHRIDPPPPPHAMPLLQTCAYTPATVIGQINSNEQIWNDQNLEKKTFNCRDDSFLFTNSFRERSVSDKWIVSDNGNGVYDYVANAAHAICIPCGSHENKLLRKTVASMIIWKWNKFKNKGSGTFCLP